jgi:hypothetical protein
MIMAWRLGVEQSEQRVQGLVVVDRRTRLAGLVRRS